ncbi:PIN domain nuclease [Thiohalocapsa halophila]|uniref:PIN domain nuclease n=1 Tax=Thiohalocapsa halophila TaxID=69359 RepID=A0ABS1CNE9_9GAMM|nr:type II toxin-antitoxin system VapC family toxin [Thiohalocapsa halophila]MBK1633468.1 PIN domain nuclease [Thiohalocapsa halophila]
MRLLLDTHALLWWLDGDERLSTNARRAIADPEATLFVSAASAWEIATKVRIGKLPGVIEVAERLSAILADQSLQPLPIGIEHARRAGLMPGEHRDPFDHMLIAQVQIEALCLVSNEKCFDRFGIEGLW